MRSQIGGLTQGVKNAQDGISMIQTFEGALTETDSILQRMKTLADQAANGTYQDDVDRDAIQLEFNQLNDELNQIADTDYNGVIVLNGGVMADGLKAVDGKFDYAKGNAATIEGATSKPGDLAAALRDDADAAGMNVDDSDYGDKAANDLWKALGITSDATDVNVTFVRGTDADGNATWSIAAATAQASKTETVKESDLTGWADTTGTARIEATTDAATTNKKIMEIADANGFDTGTITVDAATATAGNVKLTGVDKDGNAKTVEVAATAIDVTLTGTQANIGTVNVTYTAGEFKTTTVNEDITNTAKKALDVDAVLNADASGDGGFKVSWGEDGEHVVNSVTNTVDAKDGDYITINFKPSKVHAPTNIGVAEDNPVTVTPDAATGSTLSKNDIEIDVTLDPAVVSDDKMNQFLADALENLKGVTIEVDGTGAFTAVAGGAAGDIDIAADGTLSYHNGNAAVAFGKINITIDGGVAADKIEFGLKPSKYSFDSADTLRATSVLTSGDQKALFEKNTSAPESVSKSNAFEQATAPLTYTDHIILQSGARSKDAVDFTFKYSSGGLGDLEANMNCSAREDGLGTAGLSLKTAKEANYAIDRIDNAINKVSMVRATFGAVQNRLEHKIDNMNVTKENLTSAESRIRDTNIAEEMSNFTKNQILSQASQSMLAQANSLPQGVLQLLG